MTHQSVADDQYGQLWRRLKEIARRVDEGSIPLDKTMSGLQLIIEGKLEASVDRTTHPITVNYALSLEEMIAAGRYNWVNSDIIEKHFPVKGDGVVDIDIQLVHFDRVMNSSDEVIRELEKMGLRPAFIEELLAFGVKYPDIQRQFPIVALGSVWRRLFCRDVPFLWGGAGGRYLYLFWFEGRWHVDFRFLAVRK